MKLFWPAHASSKRPVDGEVLGGQQAASSGLGDDIFEEGPRDVAVEQPIAILREGRRRPHGIVHAQADKPAKQQVVFELFHQHPLAAHRIQHLEQQRPQQMLGRDRRPAGLRIHRLEARRQPAQRLIGHRPNRPQRMVGRHALLRRQVAKQVAALLVVSAHAHAPLRKGARIVVRPNRLVDPVMSRFSASC